MNAVYPLRTGQPDHVRVYDESHVLIVINGNRLVLHRRDARLLASRLQMLLRDTTDTRER